MFLYLNQSVYTASLKVSSLWTVLVRVDLAAAFSYFDSIDTINFLARASFTKLIKVAFAAIKQAHLNSLIPLWLIPLEPLAVLRTRGCYASISANSHENIIQIMLLWLVHEDDPINGLVCFGPSQSILFCVTAKLRETTARMLVSIHYLSSI